MIGGAATAAFAVLFPIGAIVLRRHWRWASRPYRIVLGVLFALAAVYAIPAACVTAAALIDAASDLAGAARALPWHVFAVAALAALALGFASLRREKFLTLNRH